MVMREKGGGEEEEAEGAIPRIEWFKVKVMLFHVLKEQWQTPKR